MADPRSPLINVRTWLMIAPKASFNYEMFICKTQLREN